jgi:PAS domain S-box-containing protein
MVAFVSGVLPTLLGGTVLLGWYLGNKTLIQVSPEFVPMQYNTALGFVVCGLGLLFSQLSKRVGIRLFGGMGFAVGFLTLFEYVFGVDLMIDQLFMEHYITVATSHPGRMAPNTALCFFLTSVAVLVYSEADEKSWSLSAIAVLGSLVFGLGTVAFSGYVMSLETAYGWGHLTRMAVHTSAGFIILGTGLFWHTWYRNKASFTHLPNWFAAAVAIVSLTVTLSLWQALDRDELAAHLILVFGILLSGVLAFAVTQFQGLRRRAADLECLQTGLEQSIADRTYELEQKSELVSAILGSMAQGIVAFDKDLRLISANDRFAAIRGYPKEMIEEGRPFADFIRYDVKNGEFGDGDPEAIFNEKMELAERFMLHEFERQRPNGRYVEVRGGPIPGGGFVSTYSDITPRKLAEAAVHENEHRLGQILENSPIAIGISVDDNSDSDGVIQFANSRFRELIGIEESDLGKARTDQFFSDQAARDDQEARLDVGESLRDMELCITGKDGQGIWTLMSINPINYQDRQSALIWLYDISEMKLVEDELRLARDAAESAGKAKAAFLATMSHEIRTPMNGVVGMIDLLQQTRLTNDQREMVDTVKGSAYSLLTIINDILDFSKIEAGKLDLESIPISICDAIEGVAETLSSTARAKDVWLRAYVDPKIPDAVLGDQVRIRQVLFNLGGNAVKFTEKGGVLIRADLLDDSTDTQAKIHIQIIDSGIGLTEEGKAGLFKAFTQAESSTTRRFGGTGLGLTICQRLVELMGSEIEVESTYGEGSTFGVTLTLPIAQKHKIRSDGHDLSGLRVLYVANNALTSAYLTHWGAEITVLKKLDEVLDAVDSATAAGTPYNIVYLVAASSMKKRRAVIKTIQAMKGLETTRFVLGAENRDLNERIELENTLYVGTAPIKRGAAIKAAAIAAGRASPDVIYDETNTPDAVREPPSVEEAEAAGQLILLAEDNLTNQKVILRQLHNLGYAADIAEDGREALKALAQKSYAILLTDCHMPNLDGFGLTTTIRGDEVAQNIAADERMPIVAITASALKAEVDHCYEVGMDDFLSKPVEVPKLRAALRKWMPGAVPGKIAKSVPEAPEASPKDGNGAVDVSALTDVFGDDPEMVKEILDEYLVSANACCREIDVSFAEQSAAGIGSAAHKLKSSSRSIGANELADICAELEASGKTDEWDAINELMPRLPHAIEAVTKFIEDL